MTNAIDNNGNQKHDNRNPVDAVHHAQVYASRLVWIRLAKYADEIGENRPNFEVIDESVHE